ncbi:hypothetical protein AGRO_0608 [Agrobacterium sp. ATCC 31749]|nr:hypothetical protein AGRO_0608 [Agrobacterium sp. ATCC 31749]
MPSRLWRIKPLSPYPAGRGVSGMSRTLSQSCRICSKFPAKSEFT